MRSATSLFLVAWLLALARTGLSRAPIKAGFADWSEDISTDKWNLQAEKTLKEALNLKPNTNLAKNVILFVGDGMGLATVTAGRIRKGQLAKRNGEEEITYMESLPHVALSKVGLSLLKQD